MSTPVPDPLDPDYGLWCRSCETCGGDGWVEDRSGNFPERPGVNGGPFIEKIECPDCYGTGCDDIPDEPLSEEEIQSIVEYVLDHDKPKEVKPTTV